MRSDSCYVYIHSRAIADDEVKVVDIDTSYGHYESVDLMFWSFKNSPIKTVYMADCLIQFSFIRDYCERNNVTITNIIKQDSTIFKMRIHGIDIINCDNIWRAPFNILCKELNLGEPSAKAVENLVEAIESIGIDRGLSFKHGNYFTIGSLAWKSLHTFSNVEDIMYKVYPMNYDRWKWFEKHNIYKGGLCLINKRYQGKDIDRLYKYDKNSFYLSVMKYGNMPKGIMRQVDGAPERMENVLVHAIITGISKFPGLAPFEDKEDFLEKEVYMWSDELQELTHWYDMEIDIIEHWTWNEFSPDKTLGRFADYYYPQKKSATGIRRHGVKLIINNTNGKFGQAPAFYRYKFENGEFKKGQRAAIDFQHIRSLAVASKITSLARTWLLRSIREATKNRPDKYYVYGDTDSMILTIPYKHTGDELGEFKFEGYFDKGVILNKKCYMLYSEDEGYECHACGVNQRALQEATNGKKWNEAREIFNYDKDFLCPTVVTVKGGKYVKMMPHKITDGTNATNWNVVHGCFEE